MSTISQIGFYITAKDYEQDLFLIFPVFQNFKICLLKMAIDWLNKNLGLSAIKWFEGLRCTEGEKLLELKNHVEKCLIFSSRIKKGWFIDSSLLKSRKDLFYSVPRLIGLYKLFSIDHYNREHSKDDLFDLLLFWKEMTSMPFIGDRHLNEIFLSFGNLIGWASTHNTNIEYK